MLERADHLERVSRSKIGDRSAGSAMTTAHAAISWRTMSYWAPCFCGIAQKCAQHLAGCRRRGPVCAGRCAGRAHSARGADHTPFQHLARRAESLRVIVDALQHRASGCSSATVEPWTASAPDGEKLYQDRRDDLSTSWCWKEPPHRLRRPQLRPAL